MALTDDEMEELFRRMHQGDSTARDKLVLGNRGLVYAIVEKSYRPLLPRIPCEYDDLVQSGVCGLINAVDRFDPSRGNKFGTYASFWIRGEIINGIRELIPRSVWEKWRKVQRAENRLQQELKRGPTMEEIAADLNMTSQEVKEALEAFAFFFPESLEELKAGGVEIARSATAMMAITVEKALSRINPVERGILIDFYLRGKSLKNIANALKKSEGYVKGTKARAEKNFANI